MPSESLKTLTRKRRETEGMLSAKRHQMLELVEIQLICFLFPALPPPAPPPECFQFWSLMGSAACSAHTGITVLHCVKSASVHSSASTFLVPLIFLTYVWPHWQSFIWGMCASLNRNAPPQIHVYGCFAQEWVASLGGVAFWEKVWPCWRQCVTVGIGFEVLYAQAMPRIGHSLLLPAD